MKLHSNQYISIFVFSLLTDPEVNASGKLLQRTELVLEVLVERRHLLEVLKGNA